MKSIEGNFDDPEINELLNKHFLELRSVSPAGSTHVLDIAGLKDQTIKFWSFWDNNDLIGCGALKLLDKNHGEFKSIRVSDKFKKKGNGEKIIKHLIEESKKLQIKKISLELGGNDPIIICDDVDIQIAAKGTTWGGLLNAGQVCTSLERVFVMDSIADDFIEAVVEEAKKVRLGDPMDGQTDMGPMSSIMQLKKAEGKVERAKTEGARLLCGGNRPEEFEKGYFYNPTVFDQVTSDMEMMYVETFGPIIPIQKVKNLEEAIELANNSQYGLGCNIYTNQMKIVSRKTLMALVL